MKKVIMMMMFSMSIMGQVLINPFEPVELVTPIVTTPILYINPCTTTQNACFFSFNSTCVYDGEGEYHCECDDGYVHSDPDNDKSTCIDPCTGSCDIYNTSEQEVYCSSNLIGGQAICLQDNDTVAADCIQNPNDPKCGGVLLCSEENLGGVCKIFTESINDFSLTWYYQTSDLGGGAITSLPKSATVVNSKWEFYTLMERFFDIYNIGNVKIATGGNKSYTNSSSDIVNFNTTSDNETNVFVIQPTNKIEFKNYFGDQTPYLAVEKKGIYGETYFRQSFIGTKTFETDRFFPTLGINYLEKDDNLSVEGIDENNAYNLLDDLTYLKKIRTIIATTEYDDISKGLVICGNNDIGEYECKAIKRMAWNFRDHDYNINKPDTTSSNWSTIFDTADIVYLHEGWEAFVCKYAYDNITDCKLLNEEETYDGFNSTFLKPELLIVQPKTPEVLQEAYGDIPYALVYDEPNFNGNHVLVYADSSEDIKMYPNPIKYPRSVFNNHKGLNLYLNIGDIVKNTTLGSGSSLYDITNDKFINSTDSTPWEIESNISGTIVTYTNEKFGVHNDGMKIIYSNGIPITRYTGDVFLGYHNSFIKSISLSEGWEAYICNDVERNNCLHYDTEGELKISLVAIWGNYFTIEYMKIQPKNHATFNRFYGHREYNGNQQEYGNGLIGYVELYENIDYTGRKEIIIGSGKFKIGEDTFLKPRDVKRVKVVGGVNLTGSYGGFDPQGNWVSNEIETFLGSNIPIYHYNTFLNSITVPYSNQPSIITHAEMSANARSVAKGLYSYTPAGIVKNYYTSEDVSPESTKRKSEENFWKENEEQNKIMDNADFVYYAAHGAWDSDGGSQAVLDSFSFVSSYSKEGKSMGDYETEWMLTSACNSLGKYKCIECEDVIDGYLVTLTGEDECRHIPPTHDDCSRSIKTTEKDALEVYDDIFANGLHGFAGMYTVSKWIGTYYGESSNFWKKIKNGSSVAYSWTSSFGSYVPERNAGYIAPGPCRKYLKNGEMIYSYIHNDHFWGYGAIYGGTRPDPNKEFIKNEGFCYYSYNNGDQNGDYDFSQINPSSSDWLVLNQDEDNSFVKDSLSSNIVNYFNVKPDNVFIGDSLVSFGIENRNDFLTIESDVSVSIHDASMKDDNLVYSLKHNADIFYDNNVKSIVDKYGYEILNVNLSMIVDRHYDTDENPDKEINASEVIFSYNLSKNGNPFLEENYVKIGVNPKTGEILSVSTKISPIEESGEKIDYQKIDSDYNELVIQDGEVYLKAYCLINNQYRPAIYRVDVSDIEVVKVY